MVKDLLVSLASYERNDKEYGPDRLNKTIKMIYNTCENKNNFDLQVIINIEQRDIYEDVIKKYPELIIDYIPKGEAWEEIIRAQNNQMKKGYYFFVWISDDMVGLKPNWDKQILDKKHYFKDDLFVLYTKSTWLGREQLIFKECYKNDKIDTKHESTPIWTYKWGEFTYNLFDEFKLGREMLYAQIIKILNEKGYNRHISCDLDYESLVDNQTTVNLLHNCNIYGKMGYPIEQITNKMIEYIK